VYGRDHETATGSEGDPGIRLMIVIASVEEWVLDERTTVSVLHMYWGFLPEDV
jgi:hypothetical protein